MNKKAATIDLKGNDYAKVAERVKLFREDTVRGSIETQPTHNPDGSVTMKATIIADLSDEHSKRATGHSFGKVSTDKAFEKLETIAVGRALANMGYLASGEIASAEEMEEFEQFQENQRLEAVNAAIESIQAAKTAQELKTIWTTLGGNVAAQPEVIKAKDNQKIKLETQ